MGPRCMRRCADMSWSNLTIVTRPRGVPVIANGSWWLDEPRDGFTDRALRELDRMRLSGVPIVIRSDGDREVSREQL